MAGDPGGTDLKAIAADEAEKFMERSLPAGSSVEWDAARVSGPLGHSGDMLQNAMTGNKRNVDITSAERVGNQYVVDGSIEVQLDRPSTYSGTLEVKDLHLHATGSNGRSVSAFPNIEGGDYRITVTRGSTTLRADFDNARIAAAPVDAGIQTAMNNTAERVAAAAGPSPVDRPVEPIPSGPPPAAPGGPP
jgi:hypothetical protein